MTDDQRNMLLVADRTKSIDVVTAIVDHILAECDVTLLDIEKVFRDGAAESYLIAGDHPQIVFGMPAMLVELDAAGVTPEENRAALAATKRK